jgi:hypothetical protein
MAEPANFNAPAARRTGLHRGLDFGRQAGAHDRRERDAIGVNPHERGRRRSRSVRDVLVCWAGKTVCPHKGGASITGATCTLKVLIGKVKEDRLFVGMVGVRLAHGTYPNIPAVLTNLVERHCTRLTSASKRSSDQGCAPDIPRLALKTDLLQSQCRMCALTKKLNAPRENVESTANDLGSE